MAIEQSFYNPLPPKVSETPHQHSVCRCVRGGGLPSAAEGVHDDNVYSIACELMFIRPFRFVHTEHFFAILYFSGLVDLIIAKDNKAVIEILLKGRSIKMRYVHRADRVNLGWLYDVFFSSNFRC